MQVHCVFQTVEYANIDENGNFDGVEKVKVLMAIFELPETADRFISSHNKVGDFGELTPEIWNVQ